MVVAYGSTVESGAGTLPAAGSQPALPPHEHGGLRARRSLRGRPTKESDCRC
jgi:hypothetical protein